MATLRLDENTHDLAFDSQGRLPWVTGREETAQRLRVKYQVFLGEWFMNQLDGIPFFRDILVKNPNVRVITSVLRKVLETDPGVSTVHEFRVDFDAADRAFSVHAQIVGPDGEAAEFDENFVIG